MDKCNPFIGLRMQPSPGIVRHKHNVPVCWIFCVWIAELAEKMCEIA